jgi:hypothetical protein
MANLIELNEDGEQLRHDYLVKIGSYEMIFEHQKTQIHALKMLNKDLGMGVMIEKAKAENLMEELEEWDAMIDNYHKSFCN